MLENRTLWTQDLYSSLVYVPLPKQGLRSPIHAGADADLQTSMVPDQLFPGSYSNGQNKALWTVTQQGNWIFWKAMNSTVITVCRVVLVSVFTLQIVFENSQPKVK